MPDTSFYSQPRPNRAFCPQLLWLVPAGRYTARVASFLGEGNDRVFLKLRTPKVPAFPCAALNATMLHEGMRALQTRRQAFELTEREAYRRRADEEERRGRRQSVRAGAGTVFVCLSVLWAPSTARTIPYRKRALLLPPRIT